MNKILDIIFKKYAEIPANVSPLETPELHNDFHSFVATYFGDDMSFDKCWDANVRFGNLICSYQKKAFEVGFYTAVQLLIGGEQV
ncbi:MAG: hypothetical protein NC205_00850 [Prevotella sp.]|nr:hypothetical protein [Alistipes senegalensis]MCM1357111.1 hypothetical protein [Prevotella sp.]MCM1472567.1 hypothetical protein [Muribaculaceae bacterium]